MATKLTPLADRLRINETELAALKGLTKEQLATLDAAVEVAIQTQDAAVEKGLEDALRFIPRPLRGRAATLLGATRG